ncbi:MAG: FHA domain-containing protein [Rikenellaceae bacterium]
MELLIGRDATSSRLSITIDGGRKAMYGNIDSVPRSVSREHCRVIINGDSYEIFNCNLENSTFVKGLEVDKILFDPTKDSIELGAEKYKLNILEIIRAITPKRPPQGAQREVESFPIDQLEEVWNDYQGEKMALQIKARKTSALRSITGIFSMSAVACGFIPGIADVIAVRVILYGLGFGLMIYFFITSYLSSAKEPQILADLDDRFHAHYICPNPKCKRFLGYQPYRDIKRALHSCPGCRCEYTHEDSEQETT